MPAKLTNHQRTHASNFGLGAKIALIALIASIALMALNRFNRFKRSDLAMSHIMSCEHKNKESSVRNTCKAQEKASFIVNGFSFFCQKIRVRAAQVILLRTEKSAKVGKLGGAIKKPKLAVCTKNTAGKLKKSYHPLTPCFLGVLRSCNFFNRDCHPFQQAKCNRFNGFLLQVLS